MVESNESPSAQEPYFPPDLRRAAQVAWVLGPLSFAAAFVYARIDPWGVKSSVLIMCGLPLGHVVAFVTSLLVVLLPGPHRGRLVFWGLLAYWAAIAAAFALGLLFPSSARELLPLSMACMTAAVVLAVAVPVLAATRWHLNGRRTDARTGHADPT